MIRDLYRWLVRSHPAAFRQRFEEEMLWIFDEAADSWGIASLLADAGASLGRQWLIRSDLWKWLVATVLGTVPLLIAFGSFLWDRPLCR